MDEKQYALIKDKSVTLGEGRKGKSKADRDMIWITFATELLVTHCSPNHSWMIFIF